MSRHLLLIEDDEDYAFLVRQTFAKAAPGSTFHWVRSGDEVQAYLSGSGAYEDRRRHPRPDHVLMDQQIPGLSGADLLAWIRHQPGLADLPVTAFSGSDEDLDSDKAARLGYQGCMVKPIEAETLRRVLERFCASAGFF